MIITSVSNNKIKEIVKLKEAKYIKKNKKYLIDGQHLVEEALEKNVVDEIFLVENMHYNIPIENIKVTIISENVSKYLSDTVTNQGIFAVCNFIDKDLDINNYNNILILDRVQDPGNLGTLVRTADAFNFDAVILGRGCVSLYNQKVIRSMQGSNFHIDCYENIDILDLLKNMTNFDILTTTLQTDIYLENLVVDKDKKAVILGNEAKGVAEDIQQYANKKIKIRMAGEAESLNVAIAGGIVMHYLQNIAK